MDLSATKYNNWYHKIHWCIWKTLANWIRKNQKKSSDRTRNPLSIFEPAPKSYLPQTLVSQSKNVQKRKIDCDSRGSASKKQKANKNIIKGWRDLKQFCQNLQFNVDVTNNFIFIYKIIGMVPKFLCNHTKKLVLVTHLTQDGKTLQFSDIFRGHVNVTLGKNGLITKSMLFYWLIRPNVLCLEIVDCAIYFFIYF